MSALTDCHNCESEDQASGVEAKHCMALSFAVGYGPFDIHVDKWITLLDLATGVRHADRQGERRQRRQNDSLRRSVGKVEINGALITVSTVRSDSCVGQRTSRSH